MPLSRRELLDLAMRASALPGAAPFLAAWLRAADDHAHTSSNGPPPEPPLLRSYTPVFFQAADFSCLQAFTEILIPTDEAPGAREAFCAHYIDFVLQANREENPTLAEQWRGALRTLREAGFHDADRSRRLELVEAMSRPERDRKASHPAYGAYRLVKQFTTFAFFTSRAGMIDFLDYRGNSYNISFPACGHPEHQRV